MEWLQGPVDSLFGVPDFWIQRIAKLVQFFAGLIIILDIVGHERANQFAREMADEAAKVFQSGAFARHLRASYRTLLYLMCLSGVPKLLGRNVLVNVDADVLRLLRLYSILSLLIAAVLAGLLGGFTSVEHWSALLMWAAFGFLVAMSVLPLLAAAMMGFASVLVSKMVQPAFSALASLLAREGISQVALLSSLSLFVLAFALDMSVS